MCSIMGWCEKHYDRSLFDQGFAATVSRGPDSSQVVDLGEGLLGFHRLAIMGLHPEGMQPFELEGSYAVCNGELY
ncbi:MAG: asparagine synthetase B, partial [Ruminococcus sp.]|nr:asparagine synthetase B [Ruminococcus sp.]